MIAHGFVDRATHDVDLFTEIDNTEAQRATAALRAALEDRGFESRDAERPPTDHRFVAVDPTDGSECTVEIFADGGRLQPRVMLDVGPVLHPDDLAADKVLALWGRARPRDFYDVHAQYVQLATGDRSSLGHFRVRRAGRDDPDDPSVRIRAVPDPAGRRDLVLPLIERVAADLSLRQLAPQPMLT